MRYLALAADYDGTLAHDGAVTEATVAAVKRLRDSGRKLILVTGRVMEELRGAFPELELCERVVAENGALLYDPSTRESRSLAQRPPDSFIEDLRRRGVEDVATGEVIVATWSPHEYEAIEAIRDAGLELQIIFNKGAVMILPAGVDKMTGLRAALEDLKLSAHNVVGIGDAENDHAFLQACEASVAVANAIASLKERATLVTAGSHGEGVAETIDKLIENDLAELDAKTAKGIVLGKLGDETITLGSHGHNLLVCGQSGSGKSTFVTGVIERILGQRYQMCLIDPEGDYEGLEGCRTVGDEKRAPSLDHLMQVLEEDPETSVVVNLVAVETSDRARTFTSMVAGIQDLRARSGRPHWLVIDEAHHVLPSEWAPVKSELSNELINLILITVHPEHTSATALGKIDTMVAIGREPKQLFEEFAAAVQADAPDVPDRDLARGEVAIWFREGNRLKFGAKAEPSKAEHQRHKRKYAEGQLEDDRAFRFRGPGDKLNLPVNNLMMFVQMAEGIDTETWQFHRERHDYSKWFRQSLKDAEVADQVEVVENDDGLDDKESRRRVKDIVLGKYTTPA